MIPMFLTFEMGTVLLILPQFPLEKRRTMHSPAAVRKGEMKKIFGRGKLFAASVCLGARVGI